MVEVLSESTRSRDLVQKLDLYMESGIREYWAVNTESKEIYIYTFTGYKLADIFTFKGQEQAQSVIFPGLSVSLPQVLPDGCGCRNRPSGNSPWRQSVCAALFCGGVPKRPRGGG